LDNRPLVAIVGSGSLLGRELRELLAELPVRTRLIGADTEEAGVLTEEAGEPVVMTELDEENLFGARVVILAGSAEASRRAVQITARLAARASIVDLTYTLDDHPDSFLRAPAVEPANFAAPGRGAHVVAHPAAIAVALFLCRLHAVAAVRQVIAQILEPASERGHRGIEELERQTVNLLSFKPLPKTVYDEQVGFNLLARYGAEARESLEAVEVRMERHLASLLALQANVAMPSIRVIQAPVFHGHSISVWAEFEENPGAAALEEALGSAQVDVRGRDLDPPNIVGMAGQSGISVGAITADRNNPRACWFWVVGDNIRIMAENAVAVVRTLVGHSAAGRPQ
jgi:aspartate-semialdehyde dehydrogenase